MRLLLLLLPAEKRTPRTCLSMAVCCGFNRLGPGTTPELALLLLGPLNAAVRSCMHMLVVSALAACAVPGFDCRMALPAAADVFAEVPDMLAEALPVVAEMKKLSLDPPVELL